MGRSAKEHCRPGQIVDGGGKVNMGAGQAIKPKDETSSGMERANARQAAPKKEEPKTPQELSRTDEADSGWDKIGAAGADIVRTYKSNKAAKAAK